MLPTTESFVIVYFFVKVVCSAELDQSKRTTITTDFQYQIVGQVFAVFGKNIKFYIIFKPEITKNNELEVDQFNGLQNDLNKENGTKKFSKKATVEDKIDFNIINSRFRTELVKAKFTPENFSLYKRYSKFIQKRRDDNENFYRDWLCI